MDWPGTPIKKEEWPGLQVETAQPAASPAEEPDYRNKSWADVASGAVKSAGPSAQRFASDIWHTIMNPVETIGSLAEAGSGALQMGARKLGIKTDEEDIPAAEAVGEFFKERYGSIPAVKQTLATDPVGALADVSTAITGPSSVMARAPGVAGRVGRIGETIGRSVDPLVGAGKVAKGAARVASEVIGGIGTHTGGRPLQIAAEAGAAGGERGRAFLENLRSTAPAEEALAAARQGLQTMVEQRGKAYRGEMAKLGLDKTVLDFNKIDEALTESTKIKTFKGQDISPSTTEIRKQMTQAIQEWRMLEPREFHTVEGMDALKQKLGDIYESTKPGTPERVAARKIYNSVRQTIIDQAPQYKKVMEAYEQASKQIKDMERTLSLNPNASIDTSLRKLQSVLRDNVNTSYGHRRELAEFLIKAGAPHLMERLAGQALQPWMPRGLGRLAASIGAEILASFGITAGFGATTGAAIAAPGLALMSPKLMGFGAYGAGRASRQGAPVGRAAFQAGRLSDRLNPREMVRQDAMAALREQRRSFSKQERDALRSVARGSAPIETVMYVKNLLDRAYGGPQ